MNRAITMSLQSVSTHYIKISCLIMLLLLLPVIAAAQTSPTDGIKVNTPAVHAFTNATIVTSPGQTIINGTLVIRNGTIEAVGSNISVPADARVWNMEGKTIYPGFIDAHSNLGMSDPRVELDRGSMSWNPQLRAHLSAESEYETEDDGSDKLRTQGFTAALSVPPLGIFRGETAVMSLGTGPVSDRVIRAGVAQAVSLTRSADFGFTYPTSPIGAIALIRQTLYDADWYERAHQTYTNNPAGLQRPESNAILAALADAANGRHPLLFETSSDEEILRVLRFTREFSITPWIRGNGHEYKVADAFSGQDVPLILPLAFPDKPKIKTPEDALNEDLGDLRHWYLAPENPARLAEAGISFSFTSDGLDDVSKFLGNLRKAVHAGLTPDAALAALTTNPATLLGIDAKYGTLQAGKSAAFVITDGDLFTDRTRVIDVWVDGNHFSVNTEDAVEASGEWQISTAGAGMDGILNITKNPAGRLSGTFATGGEEIKLNSASVQQEFRRLRFDIPGDKLELSGPVRFTASVSGDNLYGWAEVPGRDRIQWSGERISAAEEVESNEIDGDENGSGENGREENGSEENDRDENGSKEKERRARDLALTSIRPAMEYGRESLPDQPQHVLVQNATIWTMGPDGILENADLLISNGEVAQVGQNLSAPGNAVVINAEGKHVTPGLIDAHLHSGVNGVNEMGNAITAEVRMGDVLDINNIWMYRQIAGGLTAAHVMHGSANPIGGQNVIIKMRWGALSDELIFEGSPKTVKFALGENPKRVGTGRYPDTRMGVEQIIADRFRMALDYEVRWQEWERNGAGIPPRRDLRLDALVDILNGDILVQSHSYRQDEILMLMRLAEEFGFRIKAFHHGVEAYKVAPELAVHGAGAVVWSDWGAFKIEAYDNSLYNARLLHEAGVVTSLHSDNSQIASRMNWEAAKMVRAGVDPEVAMSMITSSTARLLGIDDRVGSLEPGKDADFVIWNGDPLSTFTKAEQTWIDGRKYFDIDEHAELQRSIADERARLIKWMMEDGND